MKREDTLCPLAIMGEDVRPSAISAPCEPDRCMLSVKIVDWQGGERSVCGLVNPKSLFSDYQGYTYKAKGVKDDE